MIKKPLKTMVFGVFDGLHRGHQFFLDEAQKYGDNLIIVVASDITVKNIKKHLPLSPLKKRILALRKEFPIATVCTGDNKIESWNIIKKYKPDLIILGYDQIKLKKSLKKIQEDYKFKIVSIKKDYKGKELHSSLL